ncbi:MAG: hypothetical protein J3R72DRAFT_239411 [Linnemannia gamsii]|nr:MAG: hypothetical protein J3R72DRAFT_239411 [Linnemannia gamsii]
MYVYILFFLIFISFTYLISFPPVSFPLFTPPSSSPFPSQSALPLLIPFTTLTTHPAYIPPLQAMTALCSLHMNNGPLGPAMQYQGKSMNHFFCNHWEGPLYPPNPTLKKRVVAQHYSGVFNGAIASGGLHGAPTDFIESHLYCGLDDIGCLFIPLIIKERYACTSSRL